MKWAHLLTVGVGLFLGVGRAWAQMPMGPDAMVRNRDEGGLQETAVLEWLAGDPRVMDTIGMDRTVRDELLKGVFAASREAINRKASIATAEVNLSELLASSKAETGTVMRAIEEIGALRTELMKVEVRALLVLRRTLSGEQYGRLYGMFQTRHGDPRGMMPPGMMGPAGTMGPAGMMPGMAPPGGGGQMPPPGEPPAAPVGMAPPMLAPGAPPPPPPAPVLPATNVAAPAMPR